MASKSVISIDIGLSAVKIAQFEETDGGLQLVDSGIASFARENAGEVADEVIIETIRTLMGEQKFRAKSVFVSIPRSQITLRRLSDFPLNANAEQIADIVAIQAESALPFGGSGVVYDFRELQRQGGQIHVELVGTRAQTADRYIQIMSALDIEVAAILPSMQALGALASGVVAEADESSTEGPVLLTDIGAGHTDLVLLRGGRVVFSRSFPTAGDKLTQAYARAQGLSFAEAEEVKRQHASLTDNDTQDPLTERWASELVREIDLSIQAANQDAIGGTVNRPNSIWVCGGCSLIPGLIEFMDARLGTREEAGLEVTRWNPLAHMEGDLPEPSEASRLAVTAGVGVVAMSDRFPFDLLPPEIKDRREREEQQRRMVVYAAAGLVVLAALVWGTWSYVTSKVSERVEVENQLVNSKQRYKRTEEQIVESFAMVEMLQPRLSPLDILQELSQELPPRKEIALKSFNLGSLDQSGDGSIAMQLEANSHADISRALTILRNSPLFASVRSGQITSVEKDNRPIFQTQVTCRLAEDTDEWVAERRKLTTQDELLVAALPSIRSEREAEVGDPDGPGEDPGAWDPVDDGGFVPLLLEEEPSDLEEPTRPAPPVELDTDIEGAPSDIPETSVDERAMEDRGGERVQRYEIGHDAIESVEIESVEIEEAP